MNLTKILEVASNITMGATDCAQPMLWALEKKKPFDAFIVYTDNETWFGDVRFLVVFQQHFHILRSAFLRFNTT